MDKLWEVLFGPNGIAGPAQVPGHVPWRSTVVQPRHEWPGPSCPVPLPTRRQPPKSVRTGKRPIEMGQI